MLHCFSLAALIRRIPSMQHSGQRLKRWKYRGFA